MILREAKRLKPGDRVYYCGMETGTEYAGTFLRWEDGDALIQADDGQVVARTYLELTL
jgi:hypothetical protein